MVNITDMESIEYKYILRALKQIGDIMVWGSYDPYHCKQEVSLNVQEDLEELIIENQIAKERDDLGFEKFESLNDYASALIEHWFKMKTQCNINWDQLKEYKWISAVCLNILFPSIVTISYYNIGFDDVEGLLLEIHKGWQLMNERLQSITIGLYYENEDKDMPNRVVKNYRKMFKQIKCKISISIPGYDWPYEIFIERKN